MLDTAVTGRVPQNPRKPAKAPARNGGGAPALRRDLGEDFAPRRRSVAAVGAAAGEMAPEEEHYVPRKRFGGLRFRLNGGVPRSIVGRVLAGGVVLAALGAAIAGMWGLRALLLENPRLVLESSSAIQITGNSHLTRAQLLTVFGEDVDRNILTVPLAERRAELERLPWVEHATVMRLLPNRFRVAIVERRPVAFVRQGTAVALVDANGVLLDMASDGDASGDEERAANHYSFPVVTGISGQDPLSTRKARMKLFTRFTTALGGHAKDVSEVDLSSPEDVKAMIPDGTSDILVHFGEKDFLHRYELYEKNLPGWKSQYPKLASADMRYERQVVLDMQPGAAVPVSEAAGDAKPAMADAKVKGKNVTSAPPPKKASEMGHPKVSPSPSVTTIPAGQHLDTAFDVHSKSGGAVKTAPKASPSTTQAGPQ